MSVMRGRFGQALVVGAVASGSGAGFACSDGENENGTAPSVTAGMSGTGGTSVASGGRAPAAGGRSAAGAGGGSSGQPTAGPGGASAGAGEGGEAATSGGAVATGGGGTSTSGSGGSPVTGGAVGSGGRDPACPENLGEAFNAGAGVPQCNDAGLVCDVAVDCASGTQVLTLTCEGEKWAGPIGCDKPYDFCPAMTGGTGPKSPSAYCEDGNWLIETYLFTIDHAHGPCPAEPPIDGMECELIGGTGTGGDRQHCGFPCGGESSAWTVLTCDAPVEGGLGVWTSDGACD
jgi:hypothetical protein